MSEDVKEVMQKVLDYVQVGFEKAYPELHKKFNYEIVAYGCPSIETQMEWQQSLKDFMNA